LTVKGANLFRAVSGLKKLFFAFRLRPNIGLSQGLRRTSQRPPFRLTSCHKGTKTPSIYFLLLTFNLFFVPSGLRGEKNYEQPILFPQLKHL
jgi:hypothetical protein